MSLSSPEIASAPSFQSDSAKDDGLRKQKCSRSSIGVGTNGKMTGLTISQTAVEKKNSHDSLFHRPQSRIVKQPPELRVRAGDTTVDLVPPSLSTAGSRWRSDHLANARLALDLVCEALDGLDNVHRLRDLGQEALCDPANARAAIDRAAEFLPRRKDVGLSAEFGEEVARALQVDAGDLGEAAEDAVHRRFGRGPVLDRGFDFLRWTVTFDSVVEREDIVEDNVFFYDFILSLNPRNFRPSAGASGCALTSPVSTRVATYHTLMALLKFQKPFSKHRYEENHAPRIFGDVGDSQVNRKSILTLGQFKDIFPLSHIGSRNFSSSHINSELARPMHEYGPDAGLGCHPSPAQGSHQLNDNVSMLNIPNQPLPPSL
ncbi:hypothetical protein KC350_g17 [Hortaea werneckii]|nr:hypothetical protein KC350_g17 [Hortaea werneckii]